MQAVFCVHGCTWARRLTVIETQTLCYRLNTENDHLGKSCGNENWFFDKIAYIEQQVRKTLVENAGQTTTPITETPAATAVTGSTVSDATSGAEYVVTTEAGSKQTVEYKVPTVAMTQTIIVIPATVVVNGTQYEVTSIADKAFKDNTTVTSITIGENVETIGESAFEGCTSLTSITIPKKVNKLGANVFKGAKKLKTITVKTTKLNSKNVSKNAFKGISNKTVTKVPKSKKKAYTTLFRKKGLSKKVKIK